MCIYIYISEGRGTLHLSSLFMIELEGLSQDVMRSSNEGAAMKI